MASVKSYNQMTLLPKNANYKLYVYAVLIVVFDPKTLKTSWIVKFGDTRQDSLAEAQKYASSAGETVGKLRGLVGHSIHILHIADVTEKAKKIDPRFDPSLIDEHYRRGFDNIMRPYMPGKNQIFENIDGSKSLELHVMDNSNGSLTYDLVEFQWIESINRFINEEETDGIIYNARPYLIEAFSKTETAINKFLLGAATGSGKEASTLALMIHLHDVKKFSNNTIHVVAPTIPSTLSEILSELANLSGMNVGPYGFVNYKRIKIYVTNQWYNSYKKVCNVETQMFLHYYASIIDSVTEIPNEHEDGIVPILFGSYHDLSEKIGKKSERYKDLKKRIGIVAIGEAHQQLSKSDNLKWKSLSNSFGTKCFYLFITGTPIDFIMSYGAAEFFNISERVLFTRHDLYNDKRTNPDSHYKNYPDFNYYGINVQDIIKILKAHPKWEDDVNGFTWKKLFRLDKTTKTFVYEDVILIIFRRLFGVDSFNSSDPLSIFNAPNLCDEAKNHILVSLPAGEKDAEVQKSIKLLKKLLIENNVFSGTVYDAYDDDLGDRKKDIENSKGRTLTLTCIKDCTGANIPKLGSLVWMRNIGSSLKFWEQATGRVGRASPEKKNCGVFVADLESTIEIMITYEERKKESCEEPFSTQEIIREFYDNYNYFTGRNGYWEQIGCDNFEEEIEKLRAKGDRGIERCYRSTDAPQDFNLSFCDKTSKGKTNLVVNGNGNKGAKNSNSKIKKQLGFDWNETNHKKNWENAKRHMIASSRYLSYMYDLTCVSDIKDFVKTAISEENLEVLNVIGSGYLWFDKIMTRPHIDEVETNRWINQFNKYKTDSEWVMDEFSGKLYQRQDGFVAEPLDFWYSIAEDFLKDYTPGMTIMDPCGGRGAAIYALHKCAKEKNIALNPKDIYYNDIDPTMVKFFRKLNHFSGIDLPEENISNIDILKGVKRMDNFISNPAFKSTLHLQILEKCINLAKNKVVFVHPAAWLHWHKPGKSLDEYASWREKFKPYVESIELFNMNTVFEEVYLAVPGSITILNKKKAGPTFLYIDPDYNYEEDLDDIHDLWIIPGEIYKSIKNKVQEKMTSSLIGTKKTQTGKYWVNHTKIRGNVNSSNSGPRVKDDFYTFFKPDVEISNTPGEWQCAGFETKLEAQNYISYCKTKFARFMLTFYKLNTDIYSGQFGLVPRMDFTKKWSNDQLYTEFGLSQQEIDLIEETILE